MRDALAREGLYRESSTEAPTSDAGLAAQWRISPTPFLLSPEQVAFFRSLGDRLLSFYRALNRLYQESVRGAQPAWVHGYLDQGKPDWLVTYSRMKRFRDLVPGVIRPDMIPTDPGPAADALPLVITELDSVPGGIGLTGALARAYSELDKSKWRMAYGKTAERSSGTSSISHKLSAISSEHFEIVGGSDGIVRGFGDMLRHELENAGRASGTQGGVFAIVVSEESQSYRPEMTWLAAALRAHGVEVYCVEPRELRFTEEALFIKADSGERPVSLLYRFFELFDLKNVPKSELILYSAKKDRVVVTPPFKPALEEKLAFALLHHPLLASFWQRELGAETFQMLLRLMPRTWILDPRPVPPHAVIPDLRLAGRPVADWRDLSHASQKDRRFVIKPSGFSELAWGSRGVSVGHDLSQPEWASALDAALAAFPTTPHILQEFRKGRQFNLAYYDAGTDDVVPMSGRVRLSPYYFVTAQGAQLAGVLATACSLEKKLIHGMRDAIMAPCSVAHP